MGTGPLIQFKGGFCIIISTDHQSMEFKGWDFYSLQVFFYCFFVFLQCYKRIRDFFAFRIVIQRPLFSSFRTMYPVSTIHNFQNQQVMGQQDPESIPVCGAVCRRQLTKFLVGSGFYSLQYSFLRSFRCSCLFSRWVQNQKSRAPPARSSPKIRYSFRECSFQRVILGKICIKTSSMMVRSSFLHYKFIRENLYRL